MDVKVDGMEINAAKRRKKREIIIDIGKVSIDIGKLVLGSIALGGILRGDIKPLALLIGGFVTSLLLIVLGIILLAITKE
ncbi:hypothetical protein AGMMS50230_04350 [Spirochaetia bacterium]|nr:hypothetical protein AGMMS50230_04350 [Spirochaetia bacterium]